MSNPPEFSRRRKILRLPQTALLYLFRVGESSRAVKQFQPMGLPPTARIVTVHHDFLYDCFALLVEDESFDEVPEGCMPPHWCVVETAV